MNRKAVSPTIEEVKFQAEKTGLPEKEAQKFFDYYSSNGWRVGKTKMVSMAHALAGWKTRWEERGRSEVSSHQLSFAQQAEIARQIRVLDADLQNAEAIGKDPEIIRKRIVELERKLNP